MQNALSNHQIVTLAVYLLGGDSHYIDTEDVAVKANEIAPNRFVWRKYPEQINIENVRTFLSDAKKEKNGGLLTGSGKKGWLLTEQGIQFAKTEVSKLSAVDLTRDRLTTRDRQFRKNERVRLLSSRAYQKCREQGVDAVTIEEIRVFFRLGDYVSDEAGKLKVSRALNLFGEDPELGQMVKVFAARIGSM
jgi:hypothetical protein